MNTSTMHCQEAPTSQELAASMRASLVASRLPVSSTAGGLGPIGVGLRANA